MASTKNGVIYPDDYNKAADILADMKVLADSVDGNIERINKNLDKYADELKNLQKDNTGNKTAIEANQNNIKALQVENAEVKAENERLRSDIGCISLIGQAEGESIDLDDSSGARFRKFGVSGNHSQETREGYNLLENEGTTQTINGVTITKQEDGTLIVSGTATDRIAYPISSNFKLYSANTYRLSGCPSGGGSNSYQLIAWNEVWTSLGSDNGSGKVITLSEDTKIAIRLNITSGTVCNNLVFKPMLVAGETQKPYEQYGATPSLEFPSEIKTVKDNVNIVVCNENLLEINKSISEITRGGVTIEILENGNIRLNGTSTSVLWVSLLELNNYLTSSWKKRFFTKGILNGYYNYVSGSISEGNVSFNVRETTTSSAVIGLNITADNFKANRVVQGTVENSLNVEYLWINTGTTFNNLEFNLQLKKESNSANFVEHQEQAITMPIQQEMLQGDYFDWENEKQTNLFEKIVLNGVDKKCTTSKAIGDGSEFQWAFTVAQSLPYVRTVYSNVAKLASDFGTVNGIRISANLTTAYVRSKIEVLNGKEATVENVNELLKTMYDNGNPAIFYIEKASNKELDFTDEQKAVAKKIKETLHTYKNITHIYSTDETSPIMNVEYAKDLNTQNNNLQNQIDEIKQLISTTQTSAMLLDNLQKEVESEVE